MADTSPELTQHALLHRGGPPGTWGNLGLWAAADSYAAACIALADAVGVAAGITRGERILSLACGAGDELRLWMERFGAGTITGVEADPASAAAARRRCANAPHCQVRVLTQSALDGSDLPPDAFDRVVCVDAAYHLTPRRRFLELAFSRLRPGGRLAFTDLTRAVPDGAALGLGAHLCGIDPADLAALPDIATRLTDVGFENPRIEALDAHVLEGFADFALRQTRRLGRDAWRRGWRKPLATALLIRALRGRLGYALVAADKPT